MYTVTSKIQYDRLKHEQNLLTFKQMQKQNELSTAQQIITNIESYGKTQGLSDSDIKKSETYQDAHAYEVTIEAEADAIELQLDELKEEMKNFSSGMQEGITQSTQFWCFGG